MGTLAETLVEKAVELGATVAGLASIGELRMSPSHLGIPILRGAGDGDGVLVVGLEHPASRPELDRFTGRGGTEGNRILMRINKDLIAWLREDLQIDAHDLPYYTEHGGIFLKDAAVLAGLGAVGVNNLMIVPGYGPRVRLRALLVAAALPSTGAIDYSPCSGCDQPCLVGCPQDALKEGSYNQDACLSHMRDASREKAGYLVMDSSCFDGNLQVNFCRECELACLIGADER
jgi:epoxyqueuosine reductase